MNYSKVKAREPRVKLGRGRRPQARALRDAKDALYREHILAVAERVFAEQGFAGTRMQDIAAAAGVSLNTLYQSWPGKEPLYRGLLVERDRQMLARVVARGPAAQAPASLEQLLALMEVHLHFFLEHPHYLRLQLQEGHAWYHRSAQPTAEEQQMWQRGLTLLQQVFNWGIRQQWLAPAPAADQARLMLAMQQARFANWVLGGMREPHAAVVARIQADFVRQFARPRLAAAMLAEDGSGLSDATRRAITGLA